MGHGQSRKDRFILINFLKRIAFKSCLHSFPVLPHLFCVGWLGKPGKEICPKKGMIPLWPSSVLMQPEIENSGAKARQIF